MTEGSPIRTVEFSVRIPPFGIEGFPETEDSPSTEKTMTFTLAVGTDGWLETDDESVFQEILRNFCWLGQISVDGLRVSESEGDWSAFTAKGLRCGESEIPFKV